MTCLSCLHFRLDGCAVNLEGWPDIESKKCEQFVYLPGSDEFVYLPGSDQSEID